MDDFHGSGESGPQTDPLDISTEVLRELQKQTCVIQESSSTLELLIKEEKCEWSDSPENQFTDGNNDPGTTNENAAMKADTRITKKTNMKSTNPHPMTVIEKLEEMVNTNTNQIWKLTKAIVSLEEQVKRMTNKLFPPQQNTQFLENFGISTELFSQRKPFAYPKVSCKEELNALESHLSTAEDFLKMIQMLNEEIEGTDFKQRMHEALFLLFKRKFLVECNWLGGGKNGPKIPMARYENIIRLFKVIAENGSNTIPYSVVQYFFKRKLANAKKGAVYGGNRKSKCRLRIKQV